MSLPNSQHKLQEVWTSLIWVEGASRETTGTSEHVVGSTSLETNPMLFTLSPWLRLVLSLGILWMDEILHHLTNPWGDGSPVNTNDNGLLWFQRRAKWISQPPTVSLDLCLLFLLGASATGRPWQLRFQCSKPSAMDQTDVPQLDAAELRSLGAALSVKELKKQLQELQARFWRGVPANGATDLSPLFWLGGFPVAKILLF